jgi:hypothetical protein
VSDLASTETLYIGELRVLGPDDTVAVGADFLPIATDHPITMTTREMTAKTTRMWRMRRIKYTIAKVLAGPQPMHAEAARRLAGAKMELVSVPVGKETGSVHNAAPADSRVATNPSACSISLLLLPGATFLTALLIRAPWSSSLAPASASRSCSEKRAEEIAIDVGGSTTPLIYSLAAASLSLLLFLAL